jgi:hypothetical protein
MTEKNAKFISGLTLGAICLILNFGFPIVTLTLGYIADAPMRLANDLASEMFDWAGGLSLGHEILVFIPVLLGVLIIGLIGLVASAFLWILKVAAMTKTLVLVGFLVGYKWQIPPATAVQSFFVILRNGIRSAGLALRDAVIESLIIPVTRRVVKPRPARVRTVTRGGSPMNSRDDDIQPVRSEAQVPEIRDVRASREMARIDDAASSWIKKIHYVYEQRRKKDALAARREVEEEDIKRISTATTRLKALEEFIRTGRRTQELQGLLDREYDIHAMDDSVTLQEGKARLAEARLREAKAEHEIKELGKPKPKEPKGKAAEGPIKRRVNEILGDVEGAGLVAKVLEDWEPKAKQGDIVAEFVVAQLRRLMDDMGTGEV